MKKFWFALLLSALSLKLTAQSPEAGDSVSVSIRPAYNRVSKFHRILFGENYRKEWAAKTKLPVIKISEKGLTPVKRGGGMQSKSLRLTDSSGKEWVIRSVEKSPDLLLPEQLRETFARDWLDDAVTAQHPFSALVVPPIADAVKVPHANPIIGVVAPDEKLGIYQKDFAHTVCLLEEREPEGESENTVKMLNELKKDNDNTFAREAFLRARLLDLLLGDWDRHEDQWRWVDTLKGSHDVFLGIPRDRDQVFRVAEGFFPKLAKRRWIAPTLQGFSGEIDDVRYSLFKTRFINAFPAAQYSYPEWKRITGDFVKAVTDSVLEEGLKRLPSEAYLARHVELLRKLKERRDNIPAAMDEYYRFINKIVDIYTSDKNELVRITDAPGKSVKITISKISKNGTESDTLMSKTYDARLTREIRLYLAKGNDSVFADVKNPPVKVRIIGDSGKKNYHITGTGKNLKLYGKEENVTVTGNTGRIQKYLSGDSLNTAFVPVNLYNVTMPLINIGINADDGFLFGAGFKHFQQEGFRKTPFANTQKLMLTHSFSTEAFRAVYEGEWTRIAGKADFTLSAAINAPDNTMNFFGRGNNTAFIKSGDFKRYYRTRFNTYQIDPALRWKNGKGRSLSIGPSLQYYTFDPSDNTGRFIYNTSLIHSYDSLTIEKNKVHAGLLLNFSSDKRNNELLPSNGTRLNLQLRAYEGLNSYSKSFMQIIPDIAFYKSLNKSSTIVIAERAGGGVTIGETAFYQSLFLGGHDNLLGYRQYRFSGRHMLYNNFEIRMKISDFANYILPGQFGFLAFNDTGRVWEKGEDSKKWHNGTGAGFYFAPAQLTVIRLLAGHSGEGWYPYIAMNFRF